MDLIKSEKGAVLSMISIYLTVLFLVVAFVIDGVSILGKKHELQSVADASSLAGTSAVKAQLVFDENGNYSGQRPVIDSDLADVYAADLLNQNVNVKDFNGHSVTITGTTAYSVDADSDGYLDSYRVEITADVESFLYGPLTGQGNQISIRRWAQSKAKLEL